MESPELYQPKHHIRIVTAASLFDGHDAAINIMRRIIQSTGVEVIHLGHNRSVQEIVDCAIQEDVQGIAITSYQGGHVEFFKYAYDLLKERGANIKLFGGGGGTILPNEIEELHNYGITRIYSPDDGREMGLLGMINDLVSQCDFSTTENFEFSTEVHADDTQRLAKSITYVENEDVAVAEPKGKNTPIFGITGTGGAGKSSLLDELIRRFSLFTELKIAIVSIDPTRKKSGGALLGDRIRMNSLKSEKIYMRSMATRQAHLSTSARIKDVINLYRHANFDLIIVETSGIGQSDTEITELSDISMYVMTSEYGAATQLEKIDMLDYADIIAINKFDKSGSEDALRDVRKQYKRNRNLWDANDEELPVFGTIAAQFNETGVNKLFEYLIFKLHKLNQNLPSEIEQQISLTKSVIIPSDRSKYLAEIADYNRQYLKHVREQSEIGSKLFQLDGTIKQLEGREGKEEIIGLLKEEYQTLEKQLAPEAKQVIEKWPNLRKKFKEEIYTYRVRGKEIKSNLFFHSLSGTKIPKIAIPDFSDWGDLIKWRFTENFPGRFPFASGVFPLKRESEDPTRMFAGEGGPERTNKRFHYLAKTSSANRLSTAFDSVTLYGEDPGHRPDIYGKVGNSGVSVATLDDAKKLYSGFDLTDPATSVSMTINGPAPILLSFFLNTAIDQQCEKYIRESGKEEEVKKKIATLIANGKQPEYYGSIPSNHNGLGLMLLGVSGDQVVDKEVYQKIKADTITKVRGTVQADILKEDQAQNTCIFSTEFALKMMGDIQQYFIDNNVRNFYSVSISGYHIAEAGANPITQLAFTLANGFTYIEYYLSRGMNINDFAPNLSFFFSNGLDPEYAVIGRVARKIWAKALKHRYGADERSQKLKYHIQTSGRSLHAQEIAFNDIRTTLQALYAIYDNTNSLHTNAYDEAITTPTEESVRRAVAIQHIINKELGMAQNQNPLQGAFIIHELTQLVEEAVMAEFIRISERGGVLGAMERMYQRSKIQEESMHYESKKHSGELPIVGVNTFLSTEGSPTIIPQEVIRSTDEEKQNQIKSVENFKAIHQTDAELALQNLTQTALKGSNIFEELMEAGKVCTLGQITKTLFEVGGEYRRNM